MVRYRTSNQERPFAGDYGRNLRGPRGHVIGPVAGQDWLSRAGQRPCSDDIVALFREFAGIRKREKNCRHGNCAQTPKRHPFRAAGAVIVAR